MSIQSGFITVMLEPPCAAVSQGERGQVNAPLDPAPLSLKACYLGPLFHKHLVFLLEDCSFTHIFKKSLKHNNHYGPKSI